MLLLIQTARRLRKLPGRQHSTLFCCLDASTALHCMRKAVVSGPSGGLHAEHRLACMHSMHLQVCFKLDPTMFSNAEKQQLPMERCMRILPHQQVG